MDGSKREDKRHRPILSHRPRPFCESYHYHEKTFTDILSRPRLVVWLEQTAGQYIQLERDLGLTVC